VAFYRSVGRTPVVLRKGLPGFAANRLQTALLREAIHLVREGVVTVAELDQIVTASIGLRWSTIGPLRSLHLNGGPGGIRHWLDHLGVRVAASWEQLGRPPMDDVTKDLLIRQTEDAVGARNFAELTADRDRRQRLVMTALRSAEPEEPEAPTT
jgi:ketoreductase RED1